MNENPKRKLTNHTKKCLDGWHSNRTFDISSYRRRMEKRGLKINARAAEFLTSFGGLFVSRKKGGSVKEFDFDAFEASRIVRPKNILEYEKTLNTKNLSVIGSFDHGRSILMGEDGVVYGVGDGYYHLLGKNGVDAINNLCSARNIVELQEGEKGEKGSDIFLKH